MKCIRNDVMWDKLLFSLLWFVWSHRYIKPILIFGVV